MMIVKEKDSFQHYCPQTIAAGADNAFNCCKGASCMAWRWATEDNPDFIFNPMVYNSDPRKNPLFIRSKTHGYCGMAGGA
jgi:hypothetical protein